ncbi:hypothetical protein AURDEDRAFT_165276 [Auricularia subglabra TFB-10046 SS5]|nr:hypothetical protein AURDEDRAFT_165276 [Auricularia subglabra TFB-10046 SS5]
MQAGLSHATWAHTLDVHDTALADGTKANYARARPRPEWAATERVDVGELPIAEPVLCAYAASFAGLLSGGAARGAMAGIRFAHDAAGCQWAGSPRHARILDAVSRRARQEHGAQARTGLRRRAFAGLRYMPEKDATHLGCFPTPDSSNTNAHTDRP